MKYVITLVSFLLVVWATLALAEEPDLVAGRVKRLKGSVTISRAAQTITVQKGTPLHESDTIITGDNASVGVIMTDNSVLSLGPNSKLAISRYVFNPAEKETSFVARMYKGTAIYMSGLIAKLNRRGVRIQTKSATIGVRGTRVAIKVKE